MSTLRKVHPLVWYATAYGGTAALLKGMGFVVFLWLAHSLPVDDYATFGLLYALQTAVATMAIAGIGESVVGLLKEHQSPAMRGQLFGAANAAFAVMGTVSIALALFLFGILAKPSIESSYGLASVILVGILSAFLSLQAGLVRLEERHLASLTLGFLGPLGGLVGGFVGFLNAQSVSAFFVGSALGLSVSVFVFGLRGIGSYGFVGSTTETSRIFKRIAPFIGIAFLGWLSGYGNNYIVCINSEYDCTAGCSGTPSSMESPFLPDCFRAISGRGGKKERAILPVAGRCRWFHWRGGDCDTPSGDRHHRGKPDLIS
jgi:O-antigen/teichoic acid export membrane protein